MKTAIVGSRGITGFDKVAEVLTQYQITEVISGGAKGVDRLAELFSYDRKLPLVVFKPDWKKFGRAAGFVRNKDIVDTAEQVIAFWDGESRGTLDSIKYAQKQGKPVYVWVLLDGKFVINT